MMICTGIAVLYMEGNELSEHRLLRGVKNRFGSTAEVGVFSMTSAGLQDVANPSELFLTPDYTATATATGGGATTPSSGAEGSCVSVLMEGTR
jgi:DNA repair protein RadA/Sms